MSTNNTNEQVMQSPFDMEGNGTQAISQESIGITPHPGQHKHSERLVFVDVLNILACIAVVALHVSLNVFNPQPTHIWLKAVVIQGLGIFAVPIFFMISGMNLLGYHEKYSTAVFFKKRVLRTGRALVLGSIACYLIFCLFPYSFYGAEQFAAGMNLFDFIKRFLTNNINDIYWFFYTIIYLYMITPVISWAMKNRRIVEFILVLCFAISIAIPYLVHLGFPSKYFETLFNWPLFANAAVMYYVSGYYVKNYLHVELFKSWVYGLVFIVSTVSMVVAGLLANGWHSSTGLHQNYDDYYIGTTSPLCVLQVLSLFLLLLSLESRFQQCSNRCKKIIARISSLSLGVYLFHILIINWWGVNSPAFLSQRPFIRLIVIYIITAIIVFIGKIAIEFTKKLFQDLDIRRYS